jgi:hypothetical protein
VDVERLRRAPPAGVPDFVHQRLPPDEPARVLDEHAEQLELLHRRLERLAGPRHEAAIDVHLDVSDLDDLLLRRCGRRRPPKHGPQAGDELGRAERLRHVVVGAELEAEHTIPLLTGCGQHDDRDTRRAANLSEEVASVPVRKHDVQEHEVGGAGAEGLSALGSRPRPDDVEAVAAKRRGERVGNRLFVLD